MSGLRLSALEQQLETCKKYCDEQDKKIMDLQLQATNTIHNAGSVAILQHECARMFCQLTDTKHTCDELTKENQQLLNREQEQAKQIAELQAEVLKLRDIEDFGQKEEVYWGWVGRIGPLERENAELAEKNNDFLGQNQLLNNEKTELVAQLKIGRCADLEVQLAELKAKYDKQTQAYLDLIQDCSLLRTSKTKYAKEVASLNQQIDELKARSTSATGRS
jgi:chromosome segregation ATPase